MLLIRRSSILFAFLIFVLSLSPRVGAIDLIGNVSSFVDHASLSGSTVILYNLALETQTDANGNFAFYGIPEGIYTIMIGHPDYSPVILTNVNVTTGCCGIYTLGFTGNTNCDTDGKRNLADITRLIDRVYISKATLCCSENGNVDGDIDGKLNLADITKLIDHIYISKAETAACL